MHSGYSIETFAKMLAKIKDGEGQYVWQGSVVNGQPDRLLGHNVNMSEYAPKHLHSNLYAAVIGDFKNGYWICDAEFNSYTGIEGTLRSK